MAKDVFIDDRKATLQVLYLVNASFGTLLDKKDFNLWEELFIEELIVVS
jgi:hypothetical protein